MSGLEFTPRGAAVRNGASVKIESPEGLIPLFDRKLFSEDVMSIIFPEYGYIHYKYPIIPSGVVQTPISIYDQLAQPGINLEIGCGGGSVSSGLAKMYPDHKFFGFDLMYGVEGGFSLNEDIPRNLTLFNGDWNIPFEDFLPHIIESDLPLNFMSLYGCAYWLSENAVKSINRVAKPGSIFRFNTKDPTSTENVIETLGHGDWEFYYKLTLGDISEDEYGTRSTEVVAIKN